MESDNEYEREAEKEALLSIYEVRCIPVPHSNYRGHRVSSVNHEYLKIFLASGVEFAGYWCLIPNFLQNYFFSNFTCALACSSSSPHDIFFLEFLDLMTPLKYRGKLKSQRRAMKSDWTFLALQYGRK